MGQRNNSSKHTAEFGPVPTDAEVREALAQGLPNPRWKRQNKINRARNKERIKESEIYAQQLANAERGRNFNPDPTKPEEDKDNGQDK